MPTVEQFLAVAVAQLGVTESPAGSNCQKYSRELERPCEFWCHDGVSWTARKSGFTSSEFPNTASTRAGRDFWVAHNAFDQTPRVGDAGYMHLTGRNGAGQPDHVGIVTGVRPDGAVETIEFNTSATDAGSQDNGGGVFRKVRARSKFLGFGHPRFQEDDMFTDDDRAALQTAATQIGQVHKVIRIWRGEIPDDNPMVMDLFDVVKRIAQSGGGTAPAAMTPIQMAAALESAAKSLRT